jgi:hypothetical protein
MTRAGLGIAHAHNAAMRQWLFAFCFLAIVAAFLWASDRITPEGERTVYTVDCAGGPWQGEHCTGRLVPAKRFRFRALKAHGEVVFWTVGASAPSGKFSDCVVTGGRDWACKPSADASRTITLQMARGVPVADATGHAQPFHAIAKWRWFGLGLRIPVGSDADD